MKDLCAMGILNSFMASKITQGVPTGCPDAQQKLSYMALSCVPHFIIMLHFIPQAAAEGSLAPTATEGQLQLRGWGPGSVLRWPEAMRSVLPAFLHPLHSDRGKGALLITHTSHSVNEN